MCLLSAGNTQWQSLLDVLPCLNCQGPATAATPALITDWARGWEPVCRIWSNLPVTLWLPSARTGQPPSGKWLLILVSANGEMRSGFISNYQKKSIKFLISFFSFKGWSLLTEQWRFSVSQSSPLLWPIITSRTIIQTWLLPWGRLLTLHHLMNLLCWPGTVRRCQRKQQIKGSRSVSVQGSWFVIFYWQNLLKY